MINIRLVADFSSSKKESEIKLISTMEIWMGLAAGVNVWQCSQGRGLWCADHVLFFNLIFDYMGSVSCIYRMHMFSYMCIQVNTNFSKEKIEDTEITSSLFQMGTVSKIISKLRA